MASSINYAVQMVNVKFINLLFKSESCVNVMAAEHNKYARVRYRRRRRGCSMFLTISKVIHKCSISTPAGVDVCRRTSVAGQPTGKVCVDVTCIRCNFICYGCFSWNCAPFQVRRCRRCRSHGQVDEEQHENVANFVQMSQVEPKL